MPNALKRFGAKATGSFSQRFHLSLLKLTLFYSAILAVILFLSSSITYTQFSMRLQHRFEDKITIRQDVIEVTPGPRREDVQADLISSLFVVNSLLLLAAGALSYLLARLTLEPIKAAFERQRRFLSDASHELRTPLSILYTDLQNTLVEPGVSGHTKERTISNLEEVERMNKLVNDLLTLSHQDENGEPGHIYKSSVNLIKLVHDSINRLNPLAKQQQVLINFQPPLENLEIVTNADLLMQSIVNIIKNAVVYNKPGGIVEIILHKLKKQVQIDIKDTGIGINPQDLSKIFDRFYRADKSRSRQTGGSGLGLSIVQSSVEQLGGEVEIESEPEKGTTVTILLPLE